MAKQPTAVTKYWLPKNHRLPEARQMQGTLTFSEKEDILKFVPDNNIKMLHLCQVPEDGRLRTLSFSTC